MFQHFYDYLFVKVSEITIVKHRIQTCSETDTQIDMFEKLKHTHKQTHAEIDNIDRKHILLPLAE